MSVQDHLDLLVRERLLEIEQAGARGDRRRWIRAQLGGALGDERDQFGRARLLHAQNQLAAEAPETGYRHTDAHRVLVPHRDDQPGGTGVVSA